MGSLMPSETAEGRYGGIGYRHKITEPPPTRSSIHQSRIRHSAARLQSQWPARPRREANQRKITAFLF